MQERSALKELEDGFRRPPSRILGAQPKGDMTFFYSLIFRGGTQFPLCWLVSRRKLSQEIAMRKLILTIVAVVVLGAPAGQAVRADDTTVIKRDNDADQSTTVIKKKDEVNPLPVPHVEEKKTIIKKEEDKD
jgi:hypothetical protein